MRSSRARFAASAAALRLSLCRVRAAGRLNSGVRPRQAVTRATSIFLVIAAALLVLAGPAADTLDSRPSRNYASADGYVLSYRETVSGSARSPMRAYFPSVRFTA